MPETKPNALAERLTDLTERYVDFSEKGEKNLLRWQVDPGDDEIVDVFVRYHQEVDDEEADTVPDLFIRTEVPFGNNVEQYSEEIVKDIQRQYEETKPGLEEEDIDMGWVCPEPVAEESSVKHLLGVLRSLYDYHSDLMDHLVLVLRPNAVGDGEAYQLWFARLLEQEPGKELRFIVLDPIERPLLDGLAQNHEEKVHSEPLQLDYFGMKEELAQGESDPEAPDTKFRVLFARLSNQATQKDLLGAETTAAAALALAESQSWYQMQVVVHMTLAATYLQAQDFRGGLRAYGDAIATSRRAKEAEDPAGPKMELQALLGKASVLFAEAEYMKAAEVYVETAPLAEEAEEPLLTMESWRMAATCHELAKQYEYAAYYGLKALAAGEQLKEEQRAQSTLAYVGELLLRLIEAEKKSRGQFKLPEAMPDKGELHEKMEALLGPDWRDQVVTADQGKGAPQS